MSDHPQRRRSGNARQNDKKRKRSSHGTPRHRQPYVPVAKRPNLGTYYRRPIIIRHSSAERQKSRSRSRSRSGSSHSSGGSSRRASSGSSNQSVELHHDPVLGVLDGVTAQQLVQLYTYNPALLEVNSHKPTVFTLFVRYLESMLKTMDTAARMPDYYARSGVGVWRLAATISLHDVLQLLHDDMEMKLLFSQTPADAPYHQNPLTGFADAINVNNILFARRRQAAEFDKVASALQEAYQHRLNHDIEFVKFYGDDYSLEDMLTAKHWLVQEWVRVASATLKTFVNLLYSLVHKDELPARVILPLWLTAIINDAVPIKTPPLVITLVSSDPTTVLSDYWRVTHFHQDPRLLARFFHMFVYNAAKNERRFEYLAALQREAEAIISPV